MEERRDQQQKQQQNRQQQQQQQDQLRQPRQGQKGQGQQGAGLGGSGQQRQFDVQGIGQRAGGGATTGRFADQIREHMEVIDADGQHCGTVDHCEGDRIKLTRSDSPTGAHRYVPLTLVAGIEGDKVRLRERGDNVFGMESRG